MQSCNLHAVMTFTNFKFTSKVVFIFTFSVCVSMSVNLQIYVWASDLFPLQPISVPACNLSMCRTAHYHWAGSVWTVRSHLLPDCHSSLLSPLSLRSSFRNSVFPHWPWTSLVFVTLISRPHPFFRFPNTILPLLQQLARSRLHLLFFSSVQSDTSETLFVLLAPA